MRTEQFNVRLPTTLVRDLDILSKLLQVNKSEFVKVKIAEIVNKEKSKLISELESLHKKGIITKPELKKILKQQYSIHL